MPSLKDTKRRITSVKSTQKITRAMKLVSAAKFARANQAIHAARPYAMAFQSMVGRLLAENQDSDVSGLLAVKPETRALVIVVSSDRGLCGGLNSQLFKVANQFLDQKAKSGVKCELWTWGKRANLWAKKRSEPCHDRREKVLDKPNFESVAKTADDVLKLFSDGRYDRVYITFSEFKSAMVQYPKVDQLLPFPKPTQNVKPLGDVILEPPFEELLPVLIRKAVAVGMLRVLLESAASEHGARMSAMDSATNNAKEVIRKLTLQYNRARQAAITKELIEIISGAEAL